MKMIKKKDNTKEMYSINANNCGLRPLASNQSVTRIVGGVQALNGDWPWQIIMFYNGGFTCGGSIINSMWVITAGIKCMTHFVFKKKTFHKFKNKFLRIFFKAHCVEGRSSVLSSFSIGLGYWDRQNVSSWSVLKQVTRIIIHPSYITNTYANDIALMKLDVSFKKNILTVYSRFSLYF
jgi:secreted trypsin-like serine protease